MKTLGQFLTLSACVLFNTAAFANGNTTIESFKDTKNILMKQVYNSPALSRTFYCDMPFNAKKLIQIPKGVTTKDYFNILNKIQFEHVVPISYIGRSFSEWRVGHPACVDDKGIPFKGRKCAGLVNREYRFAEADAYNTFPASGAVNMLRSNIEFKNLNSSIPSSFGICEMKITKNGVEPPDESKGRVARASLYMADSYQRYRISNQQLQLFNAWNKQFPVSRSECKIAKKIESIQGNENKFVKTPCIESGMW